MMAQVFNPAWGNTTSVLNATSATAAVVLPKSCDAVILTNTSATARAHVMLTTFESESAPPTGTAPTTSTGLPVLPGQQIAVYVGPGQNLLRTIATGADGSILITPASTR